MATLHVQTKDGQTANGTTLDVSLTGVAAGNHLHAATVGSQVGGTIGLLAPTSTPTATWLAGVALFTNSQVSAIQGRSELSENVASGSWTIHHSSTNAGALTGLVSESSGVATSASKGATNSAMASGVVASQQPGSITPAAGSILYTFTADDGAATAADTIDSGFTVSSDATAWNGANERGGQAHKDNVTAVAVNPTWTLPSGTQFIVAGLIEFKAAAAVGGAPVQMMTVADQFPAGAWF